MATPQEGIVTPEYLETLFADFPTFSDIVYIPPYEDELGQKFSNKFNMQTDEILQRIQALFSWWYKKADGDLQWGLDDMTVIQRKFSSAHAMLSSRLARYEANELVRKYLRESFSNEMHKTLFLKKAEEKWTETKIKAEIESSEDFARLQHDYMESIRYAGLCKSTLSSIRILIGNISQNVSTYKHERIEGMHNAKHNNETIE